MQVIYNEGWMGFAGWKELRFYTEVDLQLAALKPASTTCSQMRRLWHLGNTQHAGIECPSLIFSAGWHRKLNVVKISNRHRTSSWVTQASP